MRTIPELQLVSIGHFSYSMRLCSCTWRLGFQGKLRQ